MNELTNSRENKMTYFTASEQKRDKTRRTTQGMMEQLLTGKTHAPEEGVLGDAQSTVLHGESSPLANDPRTNDISLQILRHAGGRLTAPPAVSRGGKPNGGLSERNMHLNRRRIRLDPTAGAQRPPADSRRDDEKLSSNGSMSVSSGGSAYGRRRDARIETVNIRRLTWQGKVFRHRKAQYLAMDGGSLFCPGESRLNSVFLIKDLHDHWYRLSLTDR